MRRTGPTNTNTRKLIASLKKLSIENGVKIWKRVATDLEKPTRRKRVVNLAKIDRTALENETVVVPGKVLGTGDLTKKVTIAAFSFSDQAKEKISKSGSFISIDELAKQNPKGSKVRVIG